MRLLLLLLPHLALADVGVRQGDTYIGPVRDIDAKRDGGLYMTRDAGEAVGRLSCVGATTTEPGCVTPSAQSWAGNKTLTGTLKAPVVDAGVVSAGLMDLRGNTITGGASATLTVTSGATDAVTSSTVPAMNFSLGADITNTDLAWCFTDSAGNQRLCGSEAGTWIYAAHATTAGVATVNGGNFSSALGAGGISSGATPGGTGGTYSLTAGTGGASAGSASAGSGGAFSATAGAGGAGSGAQTGGAGGACTVGGGAAGAGRIGGTLALNGGAGGVATASFAAGAGGPVNVTAGVGGAESTSAAAAGGAVTITTGVGGAASVGTAGTGGALSITTGGGGAQNAGTGASAGAITIDTGAATGAATAATMSIGGTNAGAITLGRSGQSVATPGTLAATVETVSGSININGAGSGTAIAESGATSATIDFPNITTGTCSSQTMALTGVTTSSNLACQYPTALETGVLCMCFVSASGTVTFRCCAINGGVDVNPASGTFRARYFR